ncbi:hypothetical protein CALK_1735 [Chitinivibrio alkaliphilus ACht1]|uniref:Uncharacterized protein n=1 Tax=Chitinivibrio alkaliphilus ACht1 TaxID=1313304 RepID=U7D752_9BACT|nr:hypothetical protein CALK_1735 [Chitinivibrio alkaliphilus ACht1]
MLIRSSTVKEKKRRKKQRKSKISVYCEYEKLLLVGNNLFGGRDGHSEAWVAITLVYEGYGWFRYLNI